MTSRVAGNGMIHDGPAYGRQEQAMTALTDTSAMSRLWQEASKKPRGRDPTKESVSLHGPGPGLRNC